MGSEAEFEFQLYQEKIKKAREEVRKAGGCRLDEIDAVELVMRQEKLLYRGRSLVPSELDIQITGTGSVRVVSQPGGPTVRDIFSLDSCKQNSHKWNELTLNELTLKDGPRS